MVFLTDYTFGNVRVRHYYGDIVRRLFFLIAAVIVITHPFYANALRIELPLTVFTALVLVALAALTNPHNKSFLMADGIVAGAGMLIYQTWALFEYDSSTWLEFGLRQGIALLFMISFYFAIKTLRAMLLGKIGKRSQPGEFSHGVDEEEDIKSLAADLKEQKSAHDHLRSFRMKVLDIEEDPEEEDSPSINPSKEVSSSEPLNQYLHPKHEDDEFVSKEAREAAEYEERRRGQVAADTAKRQQELDDMAAGRG